jgi:hypothetical protein
MYRLVHLPTGYFVSEEQISPTRCRYRIGPLQNSLALKDSGTKAEIDKWFIQMGKSKTLLSLYDSPGWIRIHAVRAEFEIMEY